MWRRRVNEVVTSGPYRADWASLSQHAVPGWFKRDKLGVFIHWGVYSVPAYGNEWYPRSMYDPASPEFEHHRRTYGDQRTFGYKDFIPS
ncbi:MAG: alpha-L-fucosidase, partial [Clostridia bacterium]|nr:alpha-L-fucosidase [Clostridia bacterium]